MRIVQLVRARPSAPLALKACLWNTKCAPPGRCLPPPRPKTKVLHGFSNNAAEGTLPGYTLEKSGRALPCLLILYMRNVATLSGLPSPAGEGFADMPAVGQLAQLPPLSLLHRLGMAHANGHLLLESEGGQLGFVFQKGKLAATSSTWPEDMPERWLLAEDLLSPLEVVAPGFHIESWLPAQLARGKTQRARLFRCLQSAATHTLARALGWTQGSYAWEAALPARLMPLWDKEEEPEENHWHWLLPAARALPEVFLRERLAAVWRLPWQPGPHACEAESLPWQAQEREAVRRLKLCHIPAKAVPHAGELGIYVNVAFVLWQADIWKPAPPLQGGGISETEAWEEKLKATQKAWEGKDAFSILGLGQEAQGPEIKRAYFSLVRQFHPDKLPPKASQSTKQVAAELFAQLGAAYRCLSNEEERAALLLKLADATQEASLGLEALLSAESLFKKAARMVASRRFAQALPLLEAALKLNPMAAECWAHLGYAKRFLPGHGEKAALVDLEKAKQLNPALPDTYYFLGRLAKLRKEATQAKAFFEECLSLEPKHTEAQQELLLLVKHEMA